jgi:hypothetical protein
LGEARLVSRSRHRLSWLRCFVAFLSLSRQIQEDQYFEKTTTISFQILSSSSITLPFEGTQCRYRQRR